MESVLISYGIQRWPAVAGRVSQFFYVETMRCKYQLIVSFHVHIASRNSEWPLASRPAVIYNLACYHGQMCCPSFSSLQVRHETSYWGAEQCLNQRHSVGVAGNLIEYDWIITIIWCFLWLVGGYRIERFITMMWIHYVLARENKGGFGGQVFLPNHIAYSKLVNLLLKRFLKQKGNHC